MPKPKNKEVTNRKNKGRDFAQRIMALLIETFDLDPEQIRITQGYEQGCDIKMIGAAKEIVGLGIEAKNQGNICLGPWMVQMLTNAKKEDYGVPALIYHKPVKGNKHNWITVPFEHYLEIRKELKDLQDKLAAMEGI